LLILIVFAKIAGIRGAAKAALKFMFGEVVSRTVPAEISLGNKPREISGET
jgi:hypothetical protein